MNRVEEEEQEGMKGVRSLPAQRSSSAPLVFSQLVKSRIIPFISVCCSTYAAVGMEGT